MTGASEAAISARTGLGDAKTYNHNNYYHYNNNNNHNNYHHPSTSTSSLGTSAATVAPATNHHLNCLARTTSHYQSRCDDDQSNSEGQAVEKKKKKPLDYYYKREKEEEEEEEERGGWREDSREKEMGGVGMADEGGTSEDPRLSVLTASEEGGRARRLSLNLCCSSPLQYHHNSPATTPHHHTCKGSSGRHHHRSEPTCLNRKGLHVDEKQKVQSVIKVGGEELQVEVISSEVLVRSGSEAPSASDDKPPKKKRKFIIILKGLLSKSKRSDNKKCQGEKTNSETKEIITTDNKKENSKRSNKVCGNSERDKRRKRIRSFKKKGEQCVEGNSDPPTLRPDPCHAQHTPPSPTGQIREGGRSSSEDQEKREDRVRPCSSSSSSSGCLGTQEQLTLLFHAALTGAPLHNTQEHIDSPLDTLTPDVTHEDRVSLCPEGGHFPSKESLLNQDDPALTLVGLSLPSAADHSDEDPSETECVSSEDQTPAPGASLAPPSESAEEEDEEERESESEPRWTSECVGAECGEVPAAPCPQADQSSPHSTSPREPSSPVVHPPLHTPPTSEGEVSGDGEGDEEGTSSCPSHYSDTPSHSPSLEDICHLDATDIEVPVVDFVIPHLITPNTCEESYDQDKGWDQQQSDSDSDSSSDSSVDYDLPPIDDSVFDLQYDPYFYQGNLSLDDIPDDQPIDYPCPYDVNGDFLGGGRPFNPTFSYVDHWQYHRVNSPGDLCRSQSQPTALAQPSPQPLAIHAAPHVFLSQPLPNHLPPVLPPLQPRKRGEFSSLCSVGGSQLYTITEEAEADDPVDDHPTRRNYSESNLYLRGDTEDYDYDYDYTLPPHDLYYGDSDSDSTIHSDSSDVRGSTETLEQDPEEDGWLEDTELPSSEPGSCDNLCHTPLVNQEPLEVQEKERTDVSFITEAPESDGDEDGGQNGAGSRESQSEYPDEFFLFCSEAEVTGMEVVENMAYNNTRQEFGYYKVEKKTERGSPIDHQFLLESYGCKQGESDGETTSSSRSSWGTMKGTRQQSPSSPVYQNVPVNARLSKSNPNLAQATDDTEEPRPARPVYQNVPIPARRKHIGGRTQDNPSIRDPNSNYQVARAPSPTLMAQEAARLDLANCNLGSRGSLGDGLDRISSNGHEHSWSKNQNYGGMEDLRYAGRCRPSHSDFQLSRGGGGSTRSRHDPAGFNAYASNTSLDHDTFSRTSKIYKWNGSSSVSDLTSLSRDLSPASSPTLIRPSASACDLTRAEDGCWGEVADGEAEEPLGETSYAAWCAKVTDDNDDQDFMPPIGLSNNPSFVFTPHPRYRRVLVAPENYGLGRKLNLCTNRV
ncbi:hypothetical protein Pmani_030174 [Petrolisthes manimaculis]|uniref:Uncharacterized protein n=1 Tax=Petrolisthes manimaculis TaxID=1843537 RepID=A0AAE1NY19_9EUCA|nr:hypothetical protein Pmani_030174 [Petrolisthes manimaculis]